MIRSVGFIGYGNMATQLAQRLYYLDFKVRYIAGRDAKEAESLAKKISVLALNLEENLPETDLVLVCTSDNAIEEVFQSKSFGNSIVAHTSGAVRCLPGERNGVVYPFQTITKDKIIDWTNVPFLVESENGNTQAELVQFANRISRNVIEANTESRRTLHLCGVIMNNFVNHLGALSQKLLEDKNLPTHLLNSLMDETKEVIKSGKAAESQTGPAIRGDENTLNIHREILKDQPGLTEVYDLLTRSIQAGLK
jgi:predicted short-subunit dehydrogenase-like oxidoreductase (DUF2520 family)